jgi:hypothetical protein
VATLEPPVVAAQTHEITRPPVECLHNRVRGPALRLIAFGAPTAQVRPLPTLSSRAHFLTRFALVFTASSSRPPSSGR